MSNVIPLTVLTGFLGSGKTTLLKRLLDSPDLAGTAVIINEFGEVGLDDKIVEKVDEDAILLPSGCVCCTVRGDLTRTLQSLFRRSLAGEIPHLRRVVLETTGLADPTPIVHTLMTDEDTFRVYLLDGIVTTVDGQLGFDQLDNNFEPAKQIAIADRIVITKADLADASSLRRLEQRVRTLNRTAEIVRSVKGDVDPKRLIGLGAHEPALSGADPARWLASDLKPVRDHIELPGGEADHLCGPGCDHDHHYHAQDHDHDCGPDCDHPDHAHDTAHAHTHLHGIRSFSLSFGEPLDGNALSAGLQTLAGAYGDKLLRVKGIVTVKASSTSSIRPTRWPTGQSAWMARLTRSRDLCSLPVISRRQPYVGISKPSLARPTRDQS